jgi:ASC-1-like (ASCH) protein
MPKAYKNDNKVKSDSRQVRIYSNDAHMRSWYRMTKVHELKVLPEYFVAVSEGKKTFELRKDDRGFKVGDILRLREWNGNAYSGRSVCCKVTYILKSFQGLEDDYAILGIALDAEHYPQQVMYANDCGAQDSP